MENKLPADVQSEYEFYKAQYEALKQKEHKAQHPGIGWVKASERLPKEAGQITWRWLDKEAAYSGFDGTAFIYDKGGARVDMLYAIEIEWLDESAATGREEVEQLKRNTENIAAEHADLKLALAAMLNGYQNLSMYQRDWFTVPKDLINEYTKMALEYNAPVAESLTQSRADFIREANNRDMDGLSKAESKKENNLFEFTEWATGIAFFDDEYRLWEFCEEGKKIGDQFRFTTEELYQVFIKEQQALNAKPGEGKEGER